MNIYSRLHETGVMELSGSDQPYSPQDIDKIMELCNSLTIVPGTGEENRALCGRILIDPVDLALEARGRDDRRILDPEIADEIVSIIMTDHATAWWKRIFNVESLYLRRAQVHILREGDFIGYHTDDQANPDYIANVVFGLSDDYGGGEYVTYQAGREVPYKTKTGTLLVSLNGVPHEVARVLRGERKTLAIFFAEREFMEAAAA